MKPINETYKWHIDSSKETYISTKETCKRDMYKRRVKETYLSMTHIFVKRGLYSTKKTCKRDIYKRHVKEIPLTEEIRLKTVGSPDFSGFPKSFWVTGISIYSRWNPVWNHGHFRHIRQKRHTFRQKRRVKETWNHGHFRENVFDVYGDSRENLLGILEIVIMLSPISSVGGG